MAAKKPIGKGKTAKKPVAKRPSANPIADTPDDGKADRLAKAVLAPSVTAAVLLTDYTAHIVGEQDVGALMDSLNGGIKDMWAGDMKRPEAMLYAQAHSLQAIFVTLARRATKQEYMKQWEGYLRMALKAQNQCRMTLETLATIKNPPVVFARQANINNGGQQQVNNGTGPTATNRRTSAPAEKRVDAQTELLEASDGERLDTGATGTASGADPQMETVGAVHRTAHR